ncbi:hypothetical protein Tco_0450142 [Tanacetum coccineum]
MAAAGDIDEIEEVNANCILMANLQQASTSGTQTDKAPLYDSDGSAKYTELLEPITEPHQVQQNDSNVISTASSVEHITEVEKVNTINRKMKETNADLTTELARYKNQEKCFEINQEKYDKLERCYQKSVYQEKCLTKKINALHLSSAKQITTLNEKIATLNNHLSKEKSMVSFLQEENKRLKSDFKTREDEPLDKQIQLEKKIKELDNILVKTGQSIQTMHMLSPNPDSFYHTEEKMALDDTSPSVARKFLNEVKCTIVTLQRVVKQKMTLDIHNWSSLAHQEVQKIIKDEISPIVNQVDAKVQNFEIQFLKKAAKFVRDSKSLAKEANASLDKHKALEFEIERLLRAVFSQDIMFIVQRPTVFESSDLQTELERTKERFENCIIKKETEYAKLCNDWYKNVKNVNMTKFRMIKLIITYNIKSNGCKISWEISRVLNYAKENAHLKTTYKNLFDSINVTRAQTKIIIDSLQEKLNDMTYENAKLRSQLFDKVSEQTTTTKGTTANTKFANQLTSRIKLYSVTPLSKTRVPLKVVESNDLSNPITSNSVPTTEESKVVKNHKVIAPGMFRINPFKTFREDKFVPNKQGKASVRTKSITVSQPHVITKKDVNSDSNGLSSIGVDNTAKTKRPQSRCDNRDLNRRHYVCDILMLLLAFPPWRGGEIGIKSFGYREVGGAAKALMNAKVDELKVGDIFVARDFVDVFLKYFLGLPPQRQVEFRIDLVHEATSVAKSPYRLAPLEMQELSEQLRELQDKGRVKLRRVRAMSMTIQSSVKDKILATSSETSKWTIYPVLLADAAKSVRDAIGLSTLASQSDGQKSPVLWAEIRESSLIGPELVQETTDKVVLIKEGQSVSPFRKGVIRFGKKGKLAPSERDRLIVVDRDMFVMFEHERLNTPLCCDDIHDVTPRVSALAGCDTRSNTKNDRVPSTSKSSCIKNKEVEVEEHHRNLLLSKNKKHVSSECNNFKLAIQNDKSEVVCAMCKECLITSNHDFCVLNYVNDMNSHDKNHNDNVLNVAHQKKHKPKVKKAKKVRSKERLASPKPRKPRTCLRWSPSGRLFDLKGKLIESSDFECQSNNSNGDNACTSNPQEHTRKWFPNSTSFLGRSKDEAPEEIKTFLKKIQVLLQAPIIINDREDIGKLGAKGDIGFFIGYSANSCSYRVYNRRTRKIMEMMNITFDELSAIAFEQRIALRTAPANQNLQTPNASTTVEEFAPTPTNSSSQSLNIQITSQDVDEPSQQQHVQQQDTQAPL